jgi:serine/threonine protein kinase
LDIKPENLIMTDDFIVKLIDFDTAYLHGDEKVLSKGTENFRAPEIRERRCVKPKKADVYSAGILLFVMTTGALPFAEDMGDDLLTKLFKKGSDEFWVEHAKFIGQKEIKEQSLKDLLIAMTLANPSDRTSVKEVKKMEWMKGEVYGREELEKVYLRILREK